MRYFKDKKHFGIRPPSCRSFDSSDFRNRESFPVDASEPHR